MLQLRHSRDLRQLPAHLVDLADTLGARHVHILFDFRTHRSQSVLQVRSRVKVNVKTREKAN